MMKGRLYLKLTFLIMIFLLSNNINSQDFEISPATMNFNAEPGQTQTIPMNIINHSSQKSAFTVVLSDYIINKEGNKIIMPPASTEHSLVNWISINPPFFELNPNESRQVIVSIQAPVGDYSTKWAHINVRSTTEQTASLADKKLQTGMLVQGQIVVNAIQSPRSNVNYKMKITSLAENTNINDTIRTFTANIDNLGDKISDCKVTLLASDLSNAKEYVLQVIEFQVFPDSPRIIIMSFNKNALPKGTYSLAAILDYGPKANLEGTQMMITVD